jgi:hypothetical protein
VLRTTDPAPVRGGPDPLSPDRAKVTFRDRTPSAPSPCCPRLPGGRSHTAAEEQPARDDKEDQGDERVVDVHVRNLRRKVEVDPAQPRCVETVRGVGYRLGVEPA